MPKISDERYEEILRKMQAAKNLKERSVQKQKARKTTSEIDTSEILEEFQDNWNALEEKFLEQMESLTELWNEANEMMSELIIEVGEALANAQIEEEDE